MGLRISFRAGLTCFAGILASASALAAPGVTSAPTVMRSGPGPNYAQVQAVPPGAMVDVESCSPSWCRISWKYRAGFIPAEFLEQEPVAPPPVYVEPAPVVVAPYFWGPGWGCCGRRGWRR